MFAVAQFLPSLIGYVPSIGQLVKSLFFLPFYRETLKDGVLLRPIVGLGHTLQMEMFFSTFFAIAMRISHKYRGLICGALMVIFAIAGMLVPFESAFCRFYLNINYYSLISFVVGILSYYFLMWIKSIKISNLRVIGISGIMAVASLVVVHYSYSISRTSVLVYIMGFISFIAIITCATAYSSMKFYVPKLFLILGDASYSFYLIHYFVISVAERVLRIDSFAWQNILLMVIALVISWGISYISYLIVEKRFGGWMVKKLPF